MRSLESRVRLQLVQLQWSVADQLLQLSELLSSRRLLLCRGWAKRLDRQVCSALGRLHAALLHARRSGLLAMLLLLRLLVLLVLRW